MKPGRIILLLFMATWVSCAPEIPRHEAFVVGMSRSEVSARFGKPDRTQILTKSDENIWGPIEGFWPEIPTGATVEIWGFQSVLTMESPHGASQRAGQTELYFVSNSETVDGVGFHIEGAVYEGS